VLLSCITVATTGWLLVTLALPRNFVLGPLPKVEQFLVVLPTAWSKYFEALAGMVAFSEPTTPDEPGM
jgi:hypothetical protein